MMLQEFWVPLPKFLLSCLMHFLSFFLSYRSSRNKICINSLHKPLHQNERMQWQFSWISPSCGNIYGSILLQSKPALHVHTNTPSSFWVHRIVSLPAKPDQELWFPPFSPHVIQVHLRIYYLWVIDAIVVQRWRVVSLWSQF